MKSILIDYLCKWFNLQRKPKNEYVFYTDYFGAQSIVAKIGSTNIHDSNWLDGYRRGDRIYQVTCTIKLRG